MNVATAVALFVPGGVNLLQQQQLPWARGGVTPPRCSSSCCYAAVCLFATLMVWELFLPKMQELFLLDIQELWSIEMTPLYNKNEKLVWPPKPRSDRKISGRNHFFNKNLICSYGHYARIGCSGLPYRPKKNQVFTFLVVLFGRVMSI